MNISATETIIRINVEEILEAIGLEQIGRGRWLLEQVLRPAARRFALQIADYDRRVEATGLRAAARYLLEQNVAGIEVAGIGNLPRSGPLLLVSNHPGLSDAMAIFSCIARTDLLTVAAERPFLRALHNTSRHLIYLRSEEEEHGFVLRRVASHLRRGGATLIFPGGRIEPDPEVLPGAIDSLKHWSKSIGLIVRLVRDVRVVPVIVRGVLSRRAIRHPITRLRRLQKDREKLGAMLQIILPALRAVTVRVAFGRALEGESLLESFKDAQQITDRIIEEARFLVESPPDVWLPLSSVARAKAADGGADNRDLGAYGDDFDSASL